jgi:hypothetical protein
MNVFLEDKGFLKQKTKKGLEGCNDFGVSL